MVDEADSKSVVLLHVRVQVPPPAPFLSLYCCELGFTEGLVMELTWEQRESLRQFSSKLYKLAGIVNDGENIAVKAYNCGLTAEQVQTVLDVSGSMTCACGGIGRHA